MVPIRTGTRYRKSRSRPRLLPISIAGTAVNARSTPQVPVATVRMMPLRQQSIPIRAGSNSAQVVPVKKAETQDKRGASGEPERPRRGSANYLRLVMAMIPAPSRAPPCRRESDNR